MRLSWTKLIHPRPVRDSQGPKNVLAVSSLEDAEANEAVNQDSEGDDLDNAALTQMAPPATACQHIDLCLHRYPKTQDVGIVWCSPPGPDIRSLPPYSMRQAIEEGFILDVLESYTTYQAYWRPLQED